jgi:hypothetical protein
MSLRASVVALSLLGACTPRARHPVTKAPIASAVTKNGGNALVTEATALRSTGPTVVLPPVAVDPTVAVGRSHRPYGAKPAYLATARPLPPIAGQTAGDECRVRTRRCDERLRATLAALDGQTLAMSSPPTEVELRALRLTLAELRPLLAPYPDMGAEHDELDGLATALATQPAAQQAATRRRLLELLDLLRVQLAAAR